MNHDQPVKASADRRSPILLRRAVVTAVGLAVLSCGAIFGFFFAWVTSTMWGLDVTDPRVAIAAMQAMNASVRNPLFGAVFFGTPIALLLAASLSYGARFREVAVTLAAAAALYLFGVVLTTMAVNVPLNEALASIDIPTDRGHAQVVWSEYSDRWQTFNQIRTVASGIVLALAAGAVFSLGRAFRSSPG